MSKKFHTASEASRAINVPLSQITRLVAAGLIKPPRAGTAKNAPLLFSEADIETIRATLKQRDEAAAAPKFKMTIPQ
jgi:DNA-binding transcriptional MerR regulator